MNPPSPSTSPPWTRAVSARRDVPNTFQFVVGLVAVALTALALYPLARVVVRAVFVDGRLSTSVLTALFDEDHIGSVLAYTGLIVGLSGGAALVIGSLLAWLNERTNS